MSKNDIEKCTKNVSKNLTKHNLLFNAIFVSRILPIFKLTINKSLRLKPFKWNLHFYVNGIFFPSLTLFTRLHSGGQFHMGMNVIGNYWIIDLL